MSLSVDYTLFSHRLENFTPRNDAPSRAMALYAASVVLADNKNLSLAIQTARRFQSQRPAFYEVVLQSYLFLGFPRMLIAAEHLQSVWPTESKDSDIEAISAEESAEWFSRGERLYQRVYHEKADLLRAKVVGMAPEVFRWMLIEGYGKVLSRPELDITTRELCIVAQLMMENREKQLHSHLHGAINVGVRKELIEYVVEDIGEAAGKGYSTAKNLLGRIGL